MFAAIEGFSGTGKTTLARFLESKGWTRIPESAHMLRDVKLAERADTYSDVSLIGSVLSLAHYIARERNKKIVAEGYLVSDLVYSRIRYELGLSNAFMYLERPVIELLNDKKLCPDKFVILLAGEEEIMRRQRAKSEREKNMNTHFLKRYYELIKEYHTMLKHDFSYLDTTGSLQKSKKEIIALLEE